LAKEHSRGKRDKIPNKSLDKKTELGENLFFLTDTLLSPSQTRSFKSLRKLLIAFRSAAQSGTDVELEGDRERYEIQSPAGKQFDRSRGISFLFIRLTKPRAAICSVYSFQQAHRHDSQIHSYGLFGSNPLQRSFRQIVCSLLYVLCIGSRGMTDHVDFNLNQQTRLKLESLRNRSTINQVLFRFVTISPRYYEFRFWNP